MTDEEAYETKRQLIFKLSDACSGYDTITIVEALLEFAAHVSTKTFEEAGPKDILEILTADLEDAVEFVFSVQKG